MIGEMTTATEKTKPKKAAKSRPPLNGGTKHKSVDDQKEPGIKIHQPMKARRGQGERGVKIHQFSNPGVFLSIAQFAGEASCDRALLTRKVQRVANLQTEQSPYGVCYRLRDLITVGLMSDQQGNLDPEKLDPYRRKAYYASQLDRTRLMKETGEVVKVVDMEARCAAAAKSVAQFFDTLPDLLERDTGASPEQLVKIEECLDKVREVIYRTMLAGCDEADEQEAVEVANGVRPS